MATTRFPRHALAERLESRTHFAAVPAGPDLAAATLGQTFGSYLAGDAASTSVIALNLDTADARAPRSEIVLYVSADGSLDAGDRPIARAPVRGLAPDRRVVVRFRRFTLPADRAPGTHELLARIDDGDAIDEESEDNNVSRQGRVFIVAPLVDLVPVAVPRVRVEPRFKLTGAQGTATVQVWNVGNATFSGTPVVRAYNTTDGKIPVLLGSETRVNSTSSVTIRPGRSGRVNLSFESSTAGVAFVLVLSLDAADDATPGQFVSKILRVRHR